MGIFDFLTKKEQVPSGNEINKQLYEQFLEAKEELKKYVDHGTADPHLLAQAQVIKEAMKSGKDSLSSYHAAAAYAAIYMRVSETRKKLIREIDKIRQFYFVDVIITQLTEDSLAPQVGTGDILFVTSDKREIQEEIDLLDEKFDFDLMASTITPDLLGYGEYTLATKVNPHPKVSSNKIPTEGFTEVSPDEPNSVPIDALPFNSTNPSSDKYNNPGNVVQATEYGLVDILDNVDQAGVVALSKWGAPEGYLVSETTDGKNPSNVRRCEPSDYIKFSLSSQRVKVDIFKEFGIRKSSLSDELKDLPKFVRVGKSQIYGAMPKLKELELLEALVPATKLSKLSNGSLVGVQVPAGYDINKAIEAAKQVEGLINKKIGVDPVLGEITVENIMSTAGRLKAVPIFGTTGTLQKLDYKSDEPDDLLSSVVDIRKVICTSVGIPYELLFGGEDTKGNILKKYARYLRKLRSIQKSIEEGIRQLVYIHLANKGIEFSCEDIKVEFYNKLIEIDNLDKLEFIDTTIGLLKNAHDFFTELADRTKNPAYADKVDVTGFLKFMNEQLNVIGFHDVIRSLDTALPGNPLPIPTNIPGVNQPFIPPELPFIPVANNKPSAAIQTLSQNKPKKYVSTKKPENN